MNAGAGGLVGRAAELDALVGALAGPAPAAVVLHGEAGVGKTALLGAAVRGADVTAHVGGCLATLSWVPLLALRRALGSALPEHAAGGDVAYLVAVVRGAVGDGVLVLDDLHWADEVTLRVVTALAGRVRVLTAVRRGDPAAPATLAALHDAKFTLIDVEPLGSRATAELARRYHADLSPAALAAIQRDSGGNPLLIEELSATARPSRSLRLALAARLRPLPPAARNAVALLGLAGRELPATALGDAVGPLVEAGLAVREEDRVALRHGLLGEAAIELIGPGQRRRLHARLARLVGSPGETARHLHAAGRSAAAYRHALRAAHLAGTPGERASHLQLAAQCAPAPQAPWLRLCAAGQLAQAGRFGPVPPLLSALPDDPDARVEAALLRGRAHWETGDPAGYARALDEGGRVAALAGEAARLELDIERARLTLFVDVDEPRALDMARRAARRARELGVHEARALYVLGTAEYLATAGPWEATLTRALRLARAAQDIDIECRTASNLITAHENAGLPARGRRLGEVMISRTRRLHLWERAHRFETTVLTLAMHAGDYAAVLDRAPALLDSGGRDLRYHEQARAVLAICLADVGRGDEAVALLREGLEDAAPDRFGAGNLYQALAIVHLENDAPGAVLELVPRLLTAAQGDRRLLSATTPVIAWAALRCRRPLPDLGDHHHPMPISRAVPFEVAGVEALRAGRHDEAGAHFARAAVLWAPYHRRGELRCRWAAADARRLAGGRAAARAELIELESLAGRAGLRPLLARVRQSLRGLGVRRAAPAAGPVTPREYQVLRLVSRGLSDVEIAAELGLSRRTVESHIMAARRKLGAATRRQAAILVSDPDARETS